MPRNELIQNFGATYSIVKVLENSGLKEVIENVLPNDRDTHMSLIALIVYIELKRRLNDKFTVEGALTEMANLMAKSFDNTTIVLEPTKNMKAIAALFGYMVPMRLGV